jgi:hypothetical protein
MLDVVHAVRFSSKTPKQVVVIGAAGNEEKSSQIMAALLAVHEGKIPGGNLEGWH